MSMILDALTRAEHERQLEKQPDLKFVAPVKPQKNNSSKIWLYVGLGVLANVLILFFVIRALSGGAENGTDIAANSAELGQISDQANVTASSKTNVQQQVQPIVKSELQQQSLAQASVPEVITETPIQTQIQNPKLEDGLAEDRPLAMEANSLQALEVDRPLFYESKQPNTKPAASKSKQVNTSVKASGAATKGNVSFSSTELSADDATPIINKPKLLIDQGNEASNNAANAQGSSGSVLNLRDLPESSRANLNQYEVNVHVFDDNPTRRFVLINMDKYKEGDRIANNGPLVQEITSEGVVVDYGSGRALLPPK
jgi:hypothetical protein